MTLSSLLRSAAILCLLSAPSSAAERTAKTERVVEAILAREARAEVPRRADDLAGTLEQSDRARWAAGYVHTADGWQMFDAAATADDRVREYERRRGTEPLTPEQHLAMANWCRDQKLRDQERAHLWAILAARLHQPAMLHRLGFESINGDWMTTKEQAEVKARDRSWSQNYRKWLPRVHAVRKQFGSPQESSRAIGRDQLSSITDESAIPALETTLSFSTAEEAVDLIHHFANQNRSSFTQALARQSVLSPWEPTRALAADYLRARRADQFVPMLIDTMMTPLEMNIQHTMVNLASSMESSTGGLKLERAYVQKIAISTEKHRDLPLYVLHRVVPIMIYGRRGIVGKTPDFCADHLSKAPFALPGNVTEVDSDSATNDFSSDVRQQVMQANDDISEWNSRISLTLARSAGFPSGISPEQIWRLWATQTSTDYNSSKPIVQIQETEVFERPLIGYDRFNMSCLPQETLIVSATGPRPIESLRIGDTVLAKNIETGELSYKPVIRTTVRTPQPLTTLHTKEDSIRATLGHYFWVSGKGWRMAKEIKAGDRLHGVQGTVTVTDVSPGGREAVYNLVVEGANSYFVGESRILSHDVTPPVPTDIVVPGLAAR